MRALAVSACTCMTLRPSPFLFKAFMITGAIKFFNSDKKFGFVTPDDGGKDIYLPATAAAAADIAKLKPGLRVSFERVSDPRGEKAANLKLLAEAAPIMRQSPGPAVRQDLILYLDPATPEAPAVEDALRARKLAPVLVDYAATPLTVEQLKRLALLVAANGQSLVRRYHPVFLGLQLDDRFISEGEYWTGIAEHPALVNGPVVMSHGRAGICKSPKDVAAFLDQDKAAATEQKPKQISARLAAMINGQTVPPLAKVTPVAPAPAVAKPAPRPVQVAVKIKLPAAKKTIAPAQKAASKKAAKKPENKITGKTAKPAAKAAKKAKPPLKAKKKK